MTHSDFVIQATYVKLVHASLINILFAYPYKLRMLSITKSSLQSVVSTSELLLGSQV